MNLVYVDTSVISRIPDLRLKDEDAIALRDLGQRTDIRLVVSRKVAQELESSTTPRRAAMLGFLVTLFETLEWQSPGHAGWMGALGGGDWFGAWFGRVQDPLLLELRKVFDTADAHHVFQAVRTGCDYFLTLDSATILDRVVDHKTPAAGNLVFVTPRGLLVALTAAASSTQGAA
jgi:hypothetical protein